MRKLLRTLLVSASLIPGLAHAQSTPNWPYGYIPSPGEWAASQSSKADVNNGTMNSPVLNTPTINGPTFSNPSFANGTYSNPTIIGGTSSATALANPTVTEGGKPVLLSVTPHRSVDDYAPPTGITTDALPTFNTAIAAVQADGGGTLEMGRRGYLIDTGNLVIPRNVRLHCDAPIGGEQYAGEDWTQAPCLLVVNPAYTVSVSQDAVLDGVVVLRKGWVKPTSMRTAVQMLGAFSGTGITIAGMDAHVEHTMTVGFATCFTSTGFERIYQMDNKGDCNAGSYLDNSLDISRFTRVHYWPFSIGHVSWSNNGNYAVTGLTNNGSGAIRAAFTPGAEPPVTGDLVAFSGIIGVPQSARQRYTVTVIDSTHMDLQGSTWPATFNTGASSTSGSPTLTGVTNAAGLGLGMAMSGGNFAGGSTIIAITQIGGTPGTVNVQMSSNATSTVASGNYNFVPVTVAGGQGTIDLGYRPGKAFSWTNGQNNTCDHCFEYGYRYAYYFGPGSQWTELTASSADSAQVEDPNSFGLLLDTGSVDTMVTGGYIAGYGRALYIAAGPGPANKFSGVAFNVGSQFAPSLQFVSGPASLVNCTLAYLPLFGGENGSIVLAASTDVVLLSGNDFMTAPIQAANSMASGRLFPTSPTLTNHTGGGP